MNTGLMERIPAAERGVIASYLVERTVPADEVIWEVGAPADGCFVLDEGTVRLEVPTDEPDADAVLGYVEPGSVVGELGLVDEAPRSARAVAHTEVRIRVLSEAAYWRMSTQEPRAAMEWMRAVARDVSRKLRSMNERFASEIALSTRSASVDRMVADAKAALPWIAACSDEELQAILDEIVDALHGSARELAELAVAESGMGVVEHRVRKIAIGTRETLADLRSHFFAPPGAEDTTRRFYKPAGVIFGLVPVTNPVSTFAFKTLIALASRNAIILSGHRRAMGVADATGERVHAVLARHGAPSALVQWVRDRSSRQKTAFFMQHPDVSLILATGGPGMVRAAYASGTPAIGVGAGNAPVIIAPDADLEAAAAAVVGSKSFDNGLICGSENNLLVPAALRDAFVAALAAAGGRVLTLDERAQFESSILRKGALPPGVIGQDAHRILAHAGIDAEPTTRLIIVPARDGESVEASGWLGKEKLAPMVSLFVYETIDDAIAQAHAILVQCGLGHCAAVHTATPALAEAVAAALPASRVLVNQPAATGCGGSGNGLGVSFTLGCGYWGGSSTYENVSARHLCNVTVLAPPLNANR